MKDTSSFRRKHTFGRHKMFVLSHEVIQENQPDHTSSHEVIEENQPNHSSSNGLGVEQTALF